MPLQHPLISPFPPPPLSPLPESRHAISRLLAFTTEPKSAEIRRSSQKALIALFELNPATLTLMLPAVPKPLQESANKILKGYMQVWREGEGEGGRGREGEGGREREEERRVKKGEGRMKETRGGVHYTSQLPLSHTHIAGECELRG